MRSILILSALLVCSEASAIGRRRVQACPQPQYVPVSTGGCANLHTLGSFDALDEVNAARAARGLPPYIRDEGLTQGALGCAKFRADNLIEGHVRGGMGDFQFLPPGSSASRGGAAAWQPHDGWGACCSYERWTFAGAAYAIGRDGRRYMTLFVR